MMEDNKADKLLAQLLANPRRFDKYGMAYDLLQAYFAGFSLETLRPLLGSDDVFVQRSAAFIVSELGSQARDLVDDVVLLLRSTDRHVLYYAMESLTVCSKGEHAEKFVHVVKMLESDDDVLRGLAMRLVCNAWASQLAAAGRELEALEPRARTHTRGLQALAEESQIEPEYVAEMIHDADPLLRRYGAIAAKRLFREHPQLLTEAKASEDSDLRKFCQDVVKSEVG